MKQEQPIVYITLLFNATSSIPVSLLAKTFISSRIFSLVIRAYIWVVFIFVCPNNFDTVSIGTPLDNVVVVANVCLARWKVIGYARKSRQKKIKRKPFEMSRVSVFCQIEKMQMTT